MPLAMALGMSALHAFEGKLALRITKADQDDTPRNITFFIKNELLRTDFAPQAAAPGGQIPGSTAVIIDRSKHEFTTLMLDKKTYTVQRLTGKIRKEVSLDFSKAEFKATGRKEKIAGIDAEEYVGESDEAHYTELWVTKEVGKFLLENPGMGYTNNPGSLTAQAAWARFAYGNDFFVLRAVERKGKAGPEKFRLEVTDVERAPQSDSLFKVPDGFKKVNKSDSKPAKPKSGKPRAEE